MISIPLRSWRHSYSWLVLGTLAVVAAADFFLYHDGRLGWTAAAVAGAMLLVLGVRDSSFLRVAGGRVAGLAAVGLLLALVEQPTWLNILYILLCLAALALINTQGWDNDFLRWLGRFARWLATGWTRLFLDNGIAMRWLMRRGFSPALARGIAAWIVPALFSSVFIAIFAYANPIISGWFTQLGDAIEELARWVPEHVDAARIGFWLAFALLAWSLMRGRIAGRHRTRPTPTTDDVLSTEVAAGVTQASGGERDNILGVPTSMVIRCLVLFNLVFIVQNVLDTRYLFSEDLPAGLTLTEYVHRGAYPLIAAALLAGAFVLVTFDPHSATERSPWARRLVYLWIAQTVFLTLSASWRLVRYVQLWQLTRWRIASMIWFALVALGLIYIVWRIMRGRDNRWLVNVNAVTALLVLYACCFLNFDGMIARFNVRHCADVGGGGNILDVAYLEHLGTPALPALEWVKGRVSDPQRREWAERVSQDLHARLEADVNDWRSWTFRRQRTVEALYDVTQRNLARSRAAQQVAQAGFVPSPQADRSP